MKYKAGGGKYKHTGWVCSNKTQNGKHICKSFTIYEDELQKIIFDVFNAWLPNTDEVIKKYSKIAQSIINDTTTDESIEKINLDLEKEYKKQDRLLELVSTDMITNEDFKRMNEDISQKISELNDCISKLQEKKLFNSDTKTRINNIINSLKNAITFKSPDMIDRAFVLNYIEQINITPIDNTTAEIDIILLTGQSSKQNYAKSPKNYTKAQSKAKSDQQTSALQTVSNPSQINQMICLEHTTFINRTTRVVSGYNVLYRYNVSLQIPFGID